MAAAGLQPGVRLLPEFEGGFGDLPFAALSLLRGELQCDRNSHPAEIDLDLIPGNAIAFFGHRFVKGSDVFGIF